MVVRREMRKLRVSLRGGNRKYSKIFTNTGRCARAVKPLAPYLVGKLYSSGVSSDSRVYSRYGLDYIDNSNNSLETMASLWYRVHLILDRRRRRKLFVER